MRTQILLLVALILTGCSSQPRFVHHGGEPELMFDSKTAQVCWAGPIQKDDGVAAMDRANAELQDWIKNSDEAIAEDGDACFRALDKYRHSNLRPLSCGTIDETQAGATMASSSMMAASNRVDRLREHPDEQKVIHVKGLPYCSELK